MRKLLLFCVLVVAASLTYADGWNASAWFPNSNRGPRHEQPLPPRHEDRMPLPSHDRMTPPPAYIPAPPPVRNFDRDATIRRIHEQLAQIDERIARLDEARAHEIDHMNQLRDVLRDVESSSPGHALDPVQISIRIDATRPIDRLDFK